MAKLIVLYKATLVLYCFSYSHSETSLTIRTGLACQVDMRASFTGEVAAYDENMLVMLQQSITHACCLHSWQRIDNHGLLWILSIIPFPFSFDVGKAHIIMFSTEVYFFIEFGVRQIKTQYEWLKEDLKVWYTSQMLLCQTCVLESYNSRSFSWETMGDCYDTPSNVLLNYCWIRWLQS